MGAAKITTWLLAALVLLSPAASVAAPARCNLQAMAHVAIPAEYMHPKLMAIGDSLYNGMSSMSIDIRRAQHSAPKFIADALHIAPFRIPAYPKPILADFDDVVPKGELWIVRHLGAEMTENIRWWRDIYSSTPAAQRAQLFADNVAIAQATSGQLLCDTPAAHIIPTGGAIPVNDWGFPTQDLFGLFYNLNMRFVLNPNRSKNVPAGYGNLSQMAQVIARKPQTLLINVGANDGIWKMAFYGEPADSTDVASGLNDLVHNMGVIVWNVPRETHRVFVNLMPPPSRIANLTRASGFFFPGAHKYFSAYETFLNNTAIYSVSKREAEAMDRRIRETNQQIVHVMCGAKTVTCNPAKFDPTGKDPAKASTLLQFVDLSEMVYRYDAKHEGPNVRNTVRVQMHLLGRDCDLELDNREIRYAVQQPERCLSHGGLYSYDGMHMTMIGYGMLANQVLKTMGSAARVDPQAVATEIETKHLPSALFINFAGDGLLTHFRLFLSHADHNAPARDCNKVQNKAPCAMSAAIGVNTRH
jgi:hypothetical protein